MANQKKLPKLSKRTENLEAWLSEVTDKHNFVAREVERLDRDNVITRTRLDDLEKDAKTSNQRITKNTEQIAELRKIVETVNKKAGLLINVAAKTSARVKGIQQNKSQTAAPSAGAAGNNTLSILTSSMSIIAASLQRIDSVLAKSLSSKGIVNGSVKALPESAPALATTSPREDKKDEGAFSLLKSLFMNPAVVAALAGLVYFVLPKDVQEKIKGMLGSFADGIEEGLGKNEESGLKGFNTAIKATGIAFATYLGAKMIASVAEAITITLKLVKLLGGGKLGGKGAAVVAGLAIGGAALAARKSGDGDTEDAAAEVKAPKTKDVAPATESGAIEAPRPSSTESNNNIGLKPGGGVGLKHGAKIGIKIPEMTGEDKPVMDMIKRHEGVRHSPYKDSLGLWTVGVGHLIGDGRSLPPEWNRQLSDDEVNALFAKDYKHHKEAAQKIPGYNNLNATGKAALTDLTFNMGPSWYKKWPNFTKSLEAGDTERAARSLEDSKWYSQVGKRAETIVAMIRSSAAGAGITDSSLGTTSLAETPSSSGQQVSELSHGVNKAAMPSMKANVNNVNNSKNASSQTTRGDENSIPSPIAVRGSLAAYTRHSTAYAS